jgi:hypothetical protein
LREAPRFEHEANLDAVVSDALEEALVVRRGRVCVEGDIDVAMPGRVGAFDRPQYSVLGAKDRTCSPRDLPLSLPVATAEAAGESAAATDLEQKDAVAVEVEALAKAVGGALGEAMEAVVVFEQG